MNGVFSFKLDDLKAITGFGLRSGLLKAPNSPTGAQKPPYKVVSKKTPPKPRRKRSGYVYSGSMDYASRIIIARQKGLLRPDFAQFEKAACFWYCNVSFSAGDVAKSFDLDRTRFEAFIQYWFRHLRKDRARRRKEYLGIHDFVVDVPDPWTKVRKK